MKPTVSVIIPTYNCQQYIEKALESVINQTYSNWEIIIIDDGSTDQTKDIIKPYLNEKIKYIYQTNQGVSTARNHGLKIAQGKLISFLDADDFFLPNKLADQVPLFDNNPNLGIVNSGWYYVDEEGEIFGQQTLWEYFPKLDLESWVLWRIVLPSAMMFSHEWLKRTSGFNPTLNYAEDVELVWHLAQLGCESIWLEKITTCYRQHRHNVTSHSTPKQAQAFDLIINQFFAQTDLPDSIRQIENEARYNYLVWLAWRFYHTKYPDEMGAYLSKSLQYSRFDPRRWIGNFRGLCQNLGYELDTNELGNTPQWRQLMTNFKISQKPVMISIIIPTYNGAKTIIKTLESIFAQNYLNYEIIIIDDGSTDNTQETLTIYQDLIHYIKQEHQGLAASLNRGIYAAQGEFITFLEADGLFSPDKLAEQIAVFQDNPSIGIVQSGWCKIDEKDQPIEYIELWKFYPELDRETWLMWQPFHLSAIMFKRNWLEWVGGFDERFEGVEEMDIIMRLMTIGCQAIWLEKITTCYRENGLIEQRNNQLNQIAENWVKFADDFFARPFLPKEISQWEKIVRYRYLVWLGACAYKINDYQQMSNCLEIAWRYAPYLPTETLINLLDLFGDYSARFKKKFDFYALSNSPEWRQLTQLILFN